MYTRFKINKKELEIYLSDFRGISFPDVYTEDKGSALERAQEIIMASSNNGIIEAAQLKDGFFNTNFRNKYQVFISHSHQDIDVVQHFANLLSSKFGVRCFVDSMVWENMEDLLQVIDDKYCLNEDTGNYSYPKRNLSTAHVHAMLSIALLEMIEQCECCIFIESDNSTIPSLRLRSISSVDKTFSPWIYEEINYINMLQPRLSQRLIRLFSTLNENDRNGYVEQIIPPIPIVHGLNLDKFKNITRRELPYFLGDDESWLDVLYSKAEIIRNSDVKFL